MRAWGALGIALVGAGAIAGVVIEATAAPHHRTAVRSVERGVATSTAPRVDGTRSDAGDPPRSARTKASSFVPTSFVVADAVVPSVELFAAGGVPLERSLSNPTRHDLPLVFRVIGDHGAWLEVQVPARPNEMQAFIRADDVRVRKVPNWIRVELERRAVTLFHGDDPLLATIAAIGRPTSPTPTGWFYVAASVRLTDPSGPYGAGQLALSGFSEVYTTWGGGEGQIALHGTNTPQLLGQPTSNGCVRLDNRDLLEFQRLAPTGTPVVIVP